MFPDTRLPTRRDTGFDRGVASWVRPSGELARPPQSMPLPTFHRSFDILWSMGDAGVERRAQRGIMITSDLVKRIPLFAALPDNERASIAARAADVRLQRDEWFVLEGQTPAFFALLEGTVAVFKSIAGHDQHVHDYAPGDYFGEVPLLLGSPAIASLRAAEPSRVMRFDGADFHNLVTHCRVLNAEILKTMATRVGLLQQLAVATPTVEATLIGHRLDVYCHGLRDFLGRNRIGFTWIDLDDARVAERLADENTSSGDEPTLPISAAALEGTSLPLVVLADGRRLEAPSFRELADALELQTVPTRDTYDVVIVGSGPAGLAAAVYGASEGLSTLAVERVACGGQAGTSSRIENYLGFPAGLSGDELSGRARQQALRFGAELLVARAVVSIEPGGVGGGESGLHTIELEDGTRVLAKAIVLATGVQWRRLDVPGVDRFAGHGVYYGAAATEALSLRGRKVHLIGGGNSAGQAAMLFSSYADSVTMLVRGPSLAASMSQYLIDQLASKANVKIETEAEVVAVDGDDKLEWLDIVIGPERRGERRPSDALFVFIGARAETDWLPDDVIRDQWSYVCTGRDVMDLLEAQSASTWPLERDPFLLETSVPGIFAVGDVRHGSIKRVASGVGEGSMAIAFVHQYLAELNRAHILM
jgi:thioredoxin reductase (NADPH)